MHKTCRAIFRRNVSISLFRPPRKCLAHNADAIAVRADCGRALCADCIKASTRQRLICSDACAMALANSAKAMRLILQKSLPSARLSALYCYLCAGLSVAGTAGARIYLPVPFRVWFTAGCSLIFIASGIGYGRIANKQNCE